MGTLLKEEQKKSLGRITDQRAMLLGLYQKQLIIISPFLILGPTKEQAKNEKEQKPLKFLK